MRTPNELSTDLRVIATEVEALAIPAPAPAPDPVPDPDPVPTPDPVPDPVLDPVPTPDPVPDPDPTPLPPTPAGSVRTNSISWMFDRDYPTGTFANGGAWIVGPCKVILMTPGTKVIGTRAMNGSQINPSPRNGSTQGYDSTTYAQYGPNYSASLNATLTLPLTLQPGESLVSTISAGQAHQRPQIMACEILTVLATPPPAGSFRPQYCGGLKTLHDEANLDYSFLPRLDLAGLGAPSMADAVDLIQRPWLDHVPVWLSRYIHPSDNMADYGAALASQASVAALMLCADLPPDQKRDLVVAMVQLGIDLYGIVQDGGTRHWHANGGHGQGRKFPILFAGRALNHPDMLNIGEQDVRFSEDCQTFYNAQGKADWEIRHCTEPGRPDTGYKSCCTAVSWIGYVLAARLMGLKDAWNHDALFDYTDDYLPVARHLSTPYLNKFALAAWDRYR